MESLKLSITTNLWLMLKLIYFSNPFGLMFILKLNVPSSWIVRWELYFKLWNTEGISWFNFDITIFMCLVSIFSSDLTMISYFYIAINMIPNQTFSIVLKILVMLFSHQGFLLKHFFHHIATIFTFFNHAINKIKNNIFT